MLVGSEYKEDIATGTGNVVFINNRYYKVPSLLLSMSKLTAENLASAVKEFMKINDLNKVEFAQLAGISRPTLYKVLRQKNIEYPQMVLVGEAIGYEFIMKNNKKV